MIRTWISVWRHCDNARARDGQRRRQPDGVALEHLEPRLALSLSHTVAPFAEATQGFVAARIAPYQRHAEVAVPTAAGDAITGPASGKRQHIPLVTQRDGSAPKISPEWIQGMPGEDVVANIALEQQSFTHRHPTLSDVDRRTITVT
jgi:hypothetical protein